MSVPTETTKRHQDLVTRNTREQVVDYDIEALDQARSMFTSPRHLAGHDASVNDRAVGKQGVPENPAPGTPVSESLPVHGVCRRSVMLASRGENPAWPH